MSTTIVVGTDHSFACTAVVDVAADLARRLDAGLTLAHVVDGPVAPVHRARLEAEAARYATDGLRCTSVVDHGVVPGRTLADIAERADADLVVAGATGRSQRGALGSVASSLVRHTTRPVLIVRRAERLHTIASAEGPLRALVPLGLDDTDAAVAEALTLLAHATPIDVEILRYHAVPAPRGQRDRVLEPPSIDDVRADLGDLPSTLRLCGVYSCEGQARLDGFVRELAPKLDVDLVVCGSHHRRGVARMRDGSFAEGIALHAPVSVLIAGAPRASTVAAAE